MLEKDEGHIVTIASTAGFFGINRMIDYCTSKFAAVGFDESLRDELRVSRSKVNTTVVCPTYISTGMFQGSKFRFVMLLLKSGCNCTVQYLLNANNVQSSKSTFVRFTFNYLKSNLKL